MPTRFQRKGEPPRESQSVAFLRTPGTEKLYSGQAITMPSAARILASSAFTLSGFPVAASSSSLNIGMPCRSAMSIFTCAGAISAKARSSPVLVEARRSEPVMPRMVVMRIP